jgi:hypothetical protein
MGKAGFIDMNIKDQWDRLDSETQKWLIDNPGCIILPRTISTVISEQSGGDGSTDRHGERTLTEEEVDFIRAKANEADG